MKKKELVQLHRERSSHFSQELRMSLDFARLIAVRTRVVDYLDKPTEEARDELVPIFDQYTKDNPEYLAVYLLDATGSAVISTDRSFLGSNYGFRRYFKNAIRGTPFVEALFGVTSKQFGYYFSSPVVDSNGTTLGVVVAKRSPESVYKNIITADIYGDGYVMLTDEYGVVLYSDEQDRILKSAGMLSEEQRAVLDSEKRYGVPVVSSIHYQNIQDFVNKKMESGVLHFRDLEDKEQELLSIQKIEGFPFYFIYEIHTSDLQMIALQIAAILLGSVFLCVILAMVLLVVSMKKVLSPLRELQNVAERASTGDINQTVVIQTGDEFESVGNAFTTMFQRLSAFTGSLDLKVKEQTKSLEAQTHELEEKQRAMFNILEDVEHERKVSQELATDLEKFRLAVEQASDHIVITDKEGIILYANIAVSRITGFSNTELLGQKAGTKPLWGGLMDHSVYQGFWKTIKEEKKVYIGEFTNHRKNGEEYIAEAHVAPILDLSGNVQFFVGIERDVTHAKEVDRMKTEFISLASHQLRTPLSSMKWFSEMLLGGDAGTLTDEQKEFIMNINQSNERMIALVNSLLNISRIESGRIIIEPVETDVGALVSDVIKELDVQVHTKELTLTTNLKPGLQKILLDPKLIHEVYKNLLTNAIKYTPSGGIITIAVSVEGGEIVSQVKDSGYGIPEVDKPKVFEKFYRGKNIVKLETEGTGLGLYLVKSIIDSSGGRIWFESKEGQGTTFWFSLPLTGMKKKDGEVGINP